MHVIISIVGLPPIVPIVSFNSSKLIHYLIPYKILVMEYINDDIHERFQTFSIIMVWNVNSINLCKLLFVLNNFNTLKKIIPS